MSTAFGGSTSAVRRFALLAAFSILTLLTVGAADGHAYTFNQTLSNLGTTGTTGLTFTATSGSGQPELTRTTITESPRVWTNYAAWGSSSQRCPSSSMPSSSSAFDPSSCPSIAKIGTATVTSSAGTATGDIYVIDKTTFPWLGVDITPSTASGNPSGFTLRFALIPSWPQVDPGCDPATDPSGWCEQQLVLTTTTFGSTTLSSLSATLGGVSRSPLSSDPWVFHSDTPCDPAFSTKGVLKGSDNTNNTITDNDTLTGCVFAPEFEQTFSNPVAGQTTSITSTWSNLSSPVNVKVVQMDQDIRVAPNAGGLPSSFCPSGSMPTSTSTFDPTNCPSGAKIGTVSVDAFPNTVPAVGDAYIIAKSPIPWIGVDIGPGTASGNPSSFYLRFAFFPSLPQVDPNCDPGTEPTGFCQQFVRTTSSILPDIPITGMSFTAGTGSGDPYSLASGDCDDYETIGRFTPQTGSAVTRTDYDAVTGCS